MYLWPLSRYLSFLLSAFLSMVVSISAIAFVVLACVCAVWFNVLSFSFVEELVLMLMVLLSCALLSMVGVLWLCVFPLWGVGSLLRLIVSVLGVCICLVLSLDLLTIIRACVQLLFGIFLSSVPCA